MDAFSSANQPPLLPLSVCSVEQTRVPCQRRNDGPTVREIDSQFIPRDRGANSTRRRAFSR
jgi:hypothetical protein